jgi:hypothetical protein
MLEKHQELLEQIQSAEHLALGLYNEGAKIGPTIQRLRAAAGEVATRVAYYEASAPRKAKARLPQKNAEDAKN